MTGFTKSAINPDRIGNIVGEFSINESTYFNENLKELSEAFEGDGLDIMKNYGTIVSSKSLREQYKEKLLEDMNFDSISRTTNSPIVKQYFELQREMAEQKFDNSVEQLLDESVSVGSMNPFVGLTPPIVKREWVECFYRHVVETVSADKTVINKQIERAYLMDEKGDKHYFPEASYSKETMLGLWNSLSRKIIETALELPLVEFDLIAATPGASRKQRDSLNNDIRIVKVNVNVPDAAGTGVVNKEVVLPEAIVPNIEYGQFYGKIETTDGAGKPFVTTLAGFVDKKNGKISVDHRHVTHIFLAGTLSSENNVKSASVGWERDNYQVVIGTKPHINTGLTKEMIKTEKALYNIDAVSKTVDLMVKILNNFRDYEIKDYLDLSFDRNKNGQYVITTNFDCTPNAGFAGTKEQYIEGRLIAKIEAVATRLKSILKTPNIYFKVVANPYVMRLVEANVKWVMGDRSKEAGIMGGVKLDYSLGVVTKQHNYHFLSSDRVKITEGFRIYVMPLDGMHKTFTHYDFAFFLENDYRDPNNSLVPSVMATAMYEVAELFPIQAQIKVLNDNLDDDVTP